MKASYNILFICLLSVVSVKINAQFVDENTFIINEYFNNTVKDKTPILNNDFKNKSIFNYTISNINLVNISQIGNNNHISANADSNIQKIDQKGNYNNYEFISYYGKKDLNFEIQQLGNYNIIQVLGENSIINNLKIVQKSNFKRITITNY